MSGEDLFLDPQQTSSYAKGRFAYPAALFQQLASLTLRHERAWDVGTGNGQAAVLVAEHYKSVVATDVSEGQLGHALQHPNVTYAKLSGTPSAEELERIVGPEGSVDLITVATALHWFDLDKFYPIVKHLLHKPGGVIAAWTYFLPRLSPEIDELTDKQWALTKSFQNPNTKYVIEEYKTIPFPFERVNLAVEDKDGRGTKEDSFEVVKQMTMTDYFTWFRSCSPVQRALEHGLDVLNHDFTKSISAVWGSDAVRTATLPIHLIIGTVPQRQDKKDDLL